MAQKIEDYYTLPSAGSLGKLLIESPPCSEAKKEQNEAKRNSWVN
jgi:hypothetical protein